MRVLLFGTFDHLHPGHRFVLQEALKRACLGEVSSRRSEAKPDGRSRGEVHVVVARDKNVQQIKGKDPKQKEEERLRVLQNAFPEVHARLGDTEDFLIPVRAINPDLILLGYDQKLPPGVEEKDLPCPVERLAAFEPEKWKSSLKRSQ